MEGFEHYRGKTVYLELKNGRVYSGKVTKIDDFESVNGICWIYLIDKFGMHVTIASGEIKFIQEQK